MINDLNLKHEKGVKTTKKKPSINPLKSVILFFTRVPIDEAGASGIFRTEAAGYPHPGSIIFESGKYLTLRVIFGIFAPLFFDFIIRQRLNPALTRVLHQN